MKKRIYIVSHSSMDLVSVLDLYERYKSEREVTIIVSSTRENLQFLQSLDLPRSVLRFVHFESRENGNKKRVFAYLRQLHAEKKLLDGLIEEITGHDAELFFHSYDNDPHAGYLVSQVAKTNGVTLIDVLRILPKALKINEVLSVIGIKSILYLAIFRFVFGDLFVLSGTRNCPFLSLNLKKVKLTYVPNSVRTPGNNLAKYRYPFPGRGKTAVFLYSNSLGIAEQLHAAKNRAVVDCLVKRGFNVYIKIHPQGRRPDFLKDYDVQYIPQYIPFEFVDLGNVSLVIGRAGASLLCTGDIPTLSILKLLYPVDSDIYALVMEQTRQNPAIVYVSSMGELENIVSSLA